MNLLALGADRVNQLWDLAKIGIGRSYYHRLLDRGQQFDGKGLRGYYIDFRPKLAWPGDTEDDIPVLTLANGRRIKFATMVAQKALGHWEQWLQIESGDDRDAFLMYSDWLLETQDERGGWPVWREAGVCSSVPYSAMTQGQVASVFARASVLSHATKYADAARRALWLAAAPLEAGGTCRFYAGGRLLEEAPRDKPNGVLNGWIFAVWGFRDYALLTGDASCSAVVLESLRALEEKLPAYDAGYWSFSDLNQRLASPFYHHLHVEQLAALEMLGAPPLFSWYRRKWERQLRSMWANARAIFHKVGQTLREDRVGAGSIE